MDFTIAGLSAMCACVFSNPLELLKVRMQLQGELSKQGHYKVQYRNMFHGAYVIAKSEGVLALQKGLVPALWMQFIMNGFRLGTQEFAHSKGYITDAKGNIVFYKNVISACFSGVVGQILASPLYMVKTHMQTEAAKDIAHGFQHHHKGTWQVLKEIFDHHGMRGLYRGTAAVITGGLISSISQIVTFAYTKDMLRRKNVFPKNPYLRTLIASLFGGVAITLMVSPFDLVLIRLYNQGVDEEGKGLLYRNYMDCVHKTYRAEGFTGFYKGAVPIYVMGFHTTLCFVFWDVFNYIYNQLLPHPAFYNVKGDKK